MSKTRHTPNLDYLQCPPKMNVLNRCESAHEFCTFVAARLACLHRRAQADGLAQAV
jgi:hypothetical protein